MIIRDKCTGKEWSCPLKLEPVRMLRDPEPPVLWCIHLPGLEEPEDLQGGDWKNLIPPGDDDKYEFVPETDEERLKLFGHGFTITGHSDG